METLVTATEASNRPTWLVEALTLIQGQFDIQGRTLTDEALELYEKALRPMDSVYGPRAVTDCLLTQAKLPVVSDLTYRYACLVSPAPDWEDAWAEVQSKMGVVKPRPLTHPAIAETVRDMGGYEQLWFMYRGEHTPLSILRSQFQKSYEANVKARRMQVIEIVSTLGVSEGRRRYPDLLPSYAELQAREHAVRIRFCRLPEYGRDVRIEAQEHAKRMKLLESRPLPEEVRGFIRDIRRKANLGKGGKEFSEDADEGALVKAL